MPIETPSWWLRGVTESNINWNNVQLVSNPFTSQWTQWTSPFYQKPEQIKIEVSEEDKAAIINKLKEDRARNGDSAFFCDSNIEMFQELARQGIIKTLDNKSFWLENEEN